MIRNSLESKYAADTVALILPMEQRKMGEAAKRAFARYVNTPLITNDGTLRKSIFVETIWE